VILSGESRQHHSVERGDALRILEKSALVTSAALTRIFRQQVPALRAAVEDLSQGKTEEGFDKLDQFGVIGETEKADESSRISILQTPGSQKLPRHRLFYRLAMVNRLGTRRRNGLANRVCVDQGARGPTMPKANGHEGTGHHRGSPRSAPASVSNRGQLQP